MMRLRRASVIAGLSLLCWTATSYAECAWVFWQEVTGPPTYDSSPGAVSAWTSKEACEQALTQKISSDTELHRKDKKSEVALDYMAGKPRVWVKSKSRPDLITTMTYVCLPDTVDPRGPKGR
jgi:hypothetical protein